jgi:hypothetical protein
MNGPKMKPGTRRFAIRLTGAALAALLVVASPSKAPPADHSLALWPKPVFPDALAPGTVLVSTAGLDAAKRAA